VVLLALGGLLGCQGLSGAPSSAAQSGGLTATTPHLNFGTVVIGAKQSLTDTVRNSTASSVTISQATVTGSGYQIVGPSFPLTLPAGQSATLSLTFTPLAAGSPAGTVVLISNAPNPNTTVALSGTAVTAGQLNANPASVSFGMVQVGSSQSLSATLTNSGGANVTISQAAVAGAGFSMSGITPPLTLTPGQSFTFTTIFAPTSAGGFSGSISVVSDASNPNLTVSLSGTGTAAGQLSVSPATLSFGNVTVGASASLTGTLSATGASVTVSSGSASTPEFVVSGLSFPFTIAAGQNKVFTVTFTPQASGAASASVLFVSNAANSPANESLSGNGTPPPQHSVDLSWSENSPGVVGYNIYRGAKSGGPYTKANTALDASTAFTDSLVTAGLTYYYVTTAVDGSSNESAYSNEVAAVIPTP
jgi:hypothetical protein